MLLNVPLEVVTVTRPVVAPLGTVASKRVGDDTLIAAAGIPLKLTLVDDVNPCPRTSTGVPTFACVGISAAYASRLLFKL